MVSNLAIKQRPVIVQIRTAIEGVKKSNYRLFLKLLLDDPRYKLIKYIAVYGLFSFILIGHLVAGFSLATYEEILFNNFFIVPILLGSFAFGWKTSMSLAAFVIIFHIPNSLFHAQQGHWMELSRDSMLAILVLFSAYITGFSSDIIKKQYLASTKEQDSLRQIISDIFVKEGITENKISKVMYDELLQSLSGILFKLEGLGESSPNIEEIRYSLRRVIEEIQTSLVDLSRSSLEKFGFQTALNEIVGTFLRNTGIQVIVNNEIEDLAEDQAKLIIKIMHECLMNIHRHANANVVNIDIERNDEHLTIDIRDNGKGFVYREKSNKYFGLRTMQERVILNKGTLRISSAPGRGTGINIVLPVHKEVCR